MKYRQVRPKQIWQILIMIAAIAVGSACDVYLPSISGTVIDAHNRTPVAGVIVVCFNTHTPFGQIINVGGANSECWSISVSITDAKGQFRVAPYVDFGLQNDLKRNIRFYKPGYEELSYYQLAGGRLLDYGPLSEKYFWHRVISRPDKFVLQHSNAWDELGPLGHFVYFAQSMSFSHKFQFCLEKGRFLTAYRYFIEQFVTWQPNRNPVEIFKAQEKLTEFRELLVRGGL